MKARRGNISSPDAWLPSYLAATVGFMNKYHLQKSYKKYCNSSKEVEMHAIFGVTTQLWDM
jgi:hypothetical protein